MTSYFIDTSYWIALELLDDQNHRQAQAHWNSLDLASIDLVTTTYVLDEAVTFLSSRNAHRNAVGLGDNILLSPRIQLVHVDQDLFFEGWEYFKRYDDKRFSFTDCVSFVVMHNLGIHTALSFDGDFEQAGYLRKPE